MSEHWSRLKNNAILPLTLVIWIFYIMLPYNSHLVEKYYSNGFFAIYRHIWDFIFGWIPVPLIYILILAIAYYIYRYFLSKEKPSGSFAIIGYYLQPWINCILLLILLFYLCWGFNYKRMDTLEPFIGDVSTEMSEEELLLEFETISIHLNDLRHTLGGPVDWDVLNIDHLPEYSKALQSAFDHLALPIYGHVHARRLHPKGLLLRFSTAGIYLPFVGEGHIDPGLHPITWPFTMIHEMSHGYGYTGEDLCNFLAFIASVNSDSTFIQYSGYMAYWRYLRSNAFRSNPDAYKRIMTCMTPEVIDDLNAIIDYQDRYPDIMPMIRDMIYDSYLKSHGISDGLKSYSRLIVLAHQWKQKFGTYDLKEISHSE